MPKRKQANRAAPYLFAIAAVGVAILVRLPLTGVLGNTTPFITFMPAVLLTAYRHGFWPGISATILSAFSAWLFLINPTFTFRLATTAEAVSIGYFLVLGGFTTWLSHGFRRARVEAEEQRRLFKQTLASIGDGVIATDVNGRVTFINAVAERLIGWTRGEAIGRPIEEVFVTVSQESDATISNPAVAALRNAITAPLGSDASLVTRSGAKIPIEESAAPIRDRKGACIGSVLVFRDITQRRAADRELRASREQLHNTLESITDAFYALDRDWRFTYVNSTAANLMRRTAGEVIGRHLHELFPYAPDSDLYRTFLRVVEAQVPEHFEFQSPRSGRWFEMHVYPAGGGGVSVYYRDITGRKEVEKRLREREQRLSRLAESNVIGITFSDTSGNVFEANDEFLRIIGRTRIELVERTISWSEITPPEYAPADRNALAEATQRGACKPYEKEYVRPDGSRVPVLVGYVLLGDDRAESVAFVADLTERKRAEEALRRMNADLQHFAYGASHDLKEPLRMIGAYAQLLERRYAGSLDEDGKQYIGFISDGVKRMSNLVDAILEYSRAGEVRSGHSRVTDTANALAESLTALRSAIEESGAVVTHDDLPEVCADPLHVTQLFQNLVGNAIKYRGAESPRIHVSASSDGDFCIFSVRDNGLGLAREHQERVFGLFQRFHGRERTGTGLGLATCKRMVERYGGSMWVESEGEGKGATFGFTLPVGRMESS